MPAHSDFIKQDIFDVRRSKNAGFLQRAISKNKTLKTPLHCNNGISAIIHRNHGNHSTCTAPRQRFALYKREHTRTFVPSTL